MPIPVICSCKAKLKVADHLLGGQIRCPKCGKGQQVNEPGPDHPYYHLYAAEPSIGRSAAAPPALPPPEQVLEESPLSGEERSRLEDELQGKERLLWAGRPDPQIGFARAWLVSLGFYGGALMMLIMAIVFAFVPFREKWTAVVPLAIITTILAALGTAFPFYRRWVVGKTFYTITDKRATIWGRTKTGAAKPPIHYRPAELHSFRREAATRWGPEAGDLVFASKTVTVSDGRGPDSSFTIRYGFLMLRNAVEPEKIIREVLVDPLLDRAYE